MTRQLRYLVMATVGLGLAAGACSGEAARQERLAELRSQRRSLITQFAAAQNPIRRLQAGALDEGGVRAAQDSFYLALRSAIERDDPEGARLLDRAEAAGHDLRNMSTPVRVEQGRETPQLTIEEQRAVAAEIVELERQLRPVIDQAFEDPQVRSRFDALQDSVTAAILREEPSAQQTLDLMSSLGAQVREIDREIETLSRER